jgi:ankyrin repeat protein
MDFIEAAKKGDVPLIIELIDKGADINAPDKDGYTALMYAVRYNYVWLAKILIKAGIDVNAQDAGGRTALMWTTLYNYPLQMAELLIEAGADVNIKDKKGQTVFDFAVMEDKPELIKLLKNTNVLDKEQQIL